MTRMKRRTRASGGGSSTFAVTSEMADMTTKVCSSLIGLVMFGYGFVAGGDLEVSVHGFCRSNIAFLGLLLWAG